jgi:hypothetical protein
VNNSALSECVFGIKKITIFSRKREKYCEESFEKWKKSEKQPGVVLSIGGDADARS